MKGSLLIIGFFVLGIVVGRSTGLPTAWSLADVSFTALCLLMAAVGFSIGHAPSALSRFRRLNPRLALLPLCTIGGTLTACALASLLTPHSVAEGMAVGAGFGYYSLSGILITGSKGAELGTVALLSNIIRELLTLLGAPCWHVGSEALPPLRQAERRRRTRPCPSSPARVATNWRWSPSTTAWWSTSVSPSS